MGFDFNGVDAIEASLSELANLTEDEVYSLLKRGADVVEKNLVKYLKEHHHRTGGLEKSIAQTKGAGRILIEPKGKKVGGKGRSRKLTQRHAGSGASKRSKHHGSTKGSSMAEVGYYLEFGTPRMPATHWMETSNEECAEEFTKAVAEAWDELLKSKNL